MGAYWLNLRGGVSFRCPLIFVRYWRPGAWRIYSVRQSVPQHWWGSLVVKVPAPK